VRPDRSDDTDAKPADLYEVGTLVMIKRMERTPDGMRIIVQGTERVRLSAVETGRSITCAASRDPARSTHRRSGGSRSRQAQPATDDHGGDGAVAQRACLKCESRCSARSMESGCRIFSRRFSVSGVEEEQKMLEADTADELVRLANANLAREVEILQLRSKIASEAPG
jgi:ATP-dependent Lon protease